MKKKTIRKVALGLAATSIVTFTSGCGKKETPVPKTASINAEDPKNIYDEYPTLYTGGTYVYKGKEYKEAHNPSDEYIVNEYTGVSYDNGLNTSDLFFIRIDGKIYLATKLTDINENNIISKYYAVDTGEFLGQTLDINWYARATKDIDTLISPGTKMAEYKFSVDDDLKDKDYFNGEYGLGKNLCRESIVSATSIFSESVLTKKQIDTLLTDSLLTTSLIEKYYYPNFEIYSREDYTFIPLRYSYDSFGITTRGYTIAFNGQTSTYQNKMCQFEIEDGNNTRKIIGYRASTNENDSGYNCIYDIESSSYLDLSQVNVLDYHKELGSRTVGEIRTDLKSSSETHYTIDDLKLISTSSFESDDSIETYYIVTRGECIADNTYRYKVLGESELVSIFGSYDGSNFRIIKDGSLKASINDPYNKNLDDLQKCLTRNGLSSYIKDTYTEEELSTLLTILRKKELDLGEPINVIEKIRLNDIVVVDTSKESGESVFVESDKKYYVLLPYEHEVSETISDFNVEYYKICDNTGFGSISYDGKFVVIDNLTKTFYTVVKADGELECVTTFEDVLRNLGLEDYIQDEYTLTELQSLANRINEKQKTMTLN